MLSVKKNLPFFTTSSDEVIWFLCFRPPSEDEVRAKAPLVISCDEEKQEVSAILNTNAKQTNRTFVFDKVWYFDDALSVVTFCLPRMEICICIFTVILGIWSINSTKGLVQPSCSTSCR